MQRAISLLAQITAALALVLLVGPTAAEAASRTWVASTGVDGNPCTRSQPCATFGHAISVTDSFGEVNCIDAVGNVGILVIAKSVTISCEGGTAGILGSSDGIDINVTAADTVYLKGLDIEGLGASAAGGAGIFFEAAGTLHVEHCRIHGFVNSSVVGYGILFEPASSRSALFVTDTTIADNGAAGVGGNVKIAPLATASLVNVVMKNVRIEGGAAGLEVADNASTTIHAMIEDSLAAGSAGDGFLASTTGGRVTMLIDHSTAANNSVNGIEAIGANVEIDVGNSRIYGNAGSTAISGGGPTLLSFGNNEIIGNGRNAAITTTPTQ